MGLLGQKHLVKCRCILPQFKKRTDPVFHEFVVFSTSIDGKFNESFAQCNNCGIIHKVIDYCKSEIISSKESLKSVPTKSDVSLSIPSEVIQLLESSNSTVAQYQHVAFLIENNRVGEKVLLEKEEVDGYVTGKFLSISESGRFRVEPFTYQLGIGDKND